ncbi:MAG: LuxR C-terminal-related transcriptional regulator [Pirellulaceae bacterium]
MTTRILVVDPSHIVVRGLGSVLKGHEFDVASSAVNIADARRYLENGNVDMILCEYEFEDGSSLELQHMANERNIPLVIFSEWQHPVFVSRMVDAGAWGMLDKTASPETVQTTLRKVASGKKTWKRKDVRRVTGALATPRLESDIDFPLTQREFEVLAQLSAGQTNKMIAEKLGISYETVKEHVQHVLRKLGVNDRTQAAVLAVRRGLL